MKRIFAIAIATLLTLIPAAARHSTVIREDVTPVRIMQVTGDVTDSHLLLRPGTGQALNSAAGCCRMRTVPGSEASILFDFGQEMHGGIRVVTGAFKKSNIIRVRIRFGESVSEACCDIDGVNGATNDHAIRDFEAELPFMGVREFGNTGFRFVRIDLLDKGQEVDFNLREVSGISIGSDDPLTGSFKCSDQRLNDIWNVGARTLKLNMQDYIWDGIKRDRLVWIGDMYPEVMSVFSTFGDTDIIPKSLDQARDVYQLPGYMYGISSYSVWWLMIQREWYRHYGDYSYLKEQRYYLTGLLEQLISVIDDNGNEHLPENRFLDWPSNVNEMAENCGLHALMMMAMDCGAELCQVLGDSHLAERCLEAKARMESAAPAVAETYFKSGIAPDKPGMKQAAALMSLAGMADPFKAGDIILQKGGHGFSTFYGYFMLEALASVGRYTEAMDIISQYWGGMLDLGATSFWEDFDLDWMKNAGRIDELPKPGKIDVHKSYGAYCYTGYRHSLCHGWASGPVAWMSRHVLGIVPEGVGQNVIGIDPHLGRLDWAEGTWPSPYGTVSIRAEKTADGRILARVDAPAEITLKAGHNVILARKGLDMGQNSFKELEAGFKAVPDSIRIGAYWYWISDNISEEGVIKDLKAMKAAGITRVQLGSMGVDGVPYGKVKFMSDEWWKITRTALRTATELDIEIGIFNCPGWSQSGGPWVKEEQSMRYLARDTQSVTGDGTEQQITLPQYAQTVKVLAYPAISGASVDTVFSGEKKIGLVLDDPITVRSISVSTDKPLKTGMRLVHEGRVVASFLFDRSNWNLSVGFMPEAPVVIAVPEVNGVDFSFEVDQPGDAEISLSLSENAKVERFAEKSLAKMFQTPLPMWGEYMWETPEVSRTDSGKIDPASIIDLTDRVKGGMLVWSVPDGEWAIDTYYMKTTGVKNSPAVPEATGLETDKMSRKHIEAHFENYIAEIYRRIPAEERASWKTVVEDSYETGGTNWTDEMADAFRNAYGYDPVPFLPAMHGMIVGSEEMSDRFLWDLRRLIADRVAYEYVVGLRDISHRYGLETWLENYGHWGFPGEFLMYGGQSDQIAGEFWSEGDLGNIENRAASSAGHIYGKRQIWAESCTSGGPGFSRYPRLMKQRIDRFFTEGINSSLLHLYIQQPDDRKPGLAAWFGNEFNRNNAWFDCMDDFTTYLRRCNYMLQQGDYVADVAYFIGEDAPKMTGECSPALPEGYSFDYINAEVLKERAKVVDGYLVLDGGMRYRVLVLPKQKTMRPEVLEKIAEFVRAGLTVVGPAPVKSPSLSGWPSADERVRAAADELWGGKTGSGRVYPDGTSLDKVFSDLGIGKDFSHSAGSILFIHRNLGSEGDIYFISNQEDKPSSFKASFRVGSGLVPEIWDPVTGTRKAVRYERRGTEATIDMSLERLESAFVVFRASGAADIDESRARVLAVNGPWKVSFRESVGNPAFSVTMDKLEDWSQSSDERLKYYSGSAVYTTKFTLLKSEAKASKAEIDLGMAMVMAKVKVNGVPAGGAWTYPYKVDVSGLLTAGDNIIEVTVYNNWQNRLIGDQTRIESMRKTWTSANPWRADSALQSSGLLGPVNIITYK